jgi:gluconokinase
MSTVSSAQAERPLVVALDLGTSSARALIYDMLGRLVEGIESRIEYQMATTPEGGV